MSFGFNEGAAAERDTLAFGVSAIGVAFTLGDFVADDGGTLSGRADIVVVVSV